MSVFKFAILFLALMSLVPQHAEARRKKASRGGAGMCGAGKATTTIYNLPQEDKKDTYPSFKDFKSAVKMQGSGRRTNGKIARYKGPDVSIPSSCKTTTTSASGQCLLSYFSIAADLKSGYRMGDIIYMRSLADQEIELPSGRKIRHPGFLIVHDTGGAIKGSGRFDFFVGTVNPQKSSFQKFNIGDKKKCDNKDFQKIERGSAKYQDALAQIYKNQDSDTSRGNGSPGSSGPTQSIASNSGSAK